MAGAKGRSGGARPGSGGRRDGAGRRPSEKTIFEREFVGPLAQKKSRRKFTSEEERAAARKERDRKKYEKRAAMREIERRAECERLGREYKKYARHQKYERRTSYECVCKSCGGLFNAVMVSAKYCGPVCRTKAGNNSERAQEMRRSDLMYRLKNGFRSLLRSSLRRRGYSKRSKTQEVLGCDWETFRSHIERQFQPGMTWEKMGPEIHIDHIIPLASAKNYEDLVKLNHFTNLRPLWAVDNMRKGARLMSLV